MFGVELLITIIHLAALVTCCRTKVQRKKATNVQDDHKGRRTSDERPKLDETLPTREDTFNKVKQFNVFEGLETIKMGIYNYLCSACVDVLPLAPVAATTTRKSESSTSTQPQTKGLAFVDEPHTASTAMSPFPCNAIAQHGSFALDHRFTAHLVLHLRLAVVILICILDSRLRRCARLRRRAPYCKHGDVSVPNAVAEHGSCFVYHGFSSYLLQHIRLLVIILIFILDHAGSRRYVGYAGAFAAQAHCRQQVQAPFHLYQPCWIRQREEGPSPGWQPGWGCPRTIYQLDKYDKHRAR
ncbi:unnamed protein product, partial [Mesorhabditis spiculigera]